MDAINDAALPQWLLVPPEDAGRECVSAAEEIDALVAALSPSVVRALVDAGRPRLADRSLHRDAHLAALERAFPG
jgi:hypothetical protein